jgi:hypothetical protein
VLPSRTDPCITQPGRETIKSYTEHIALLLCKLAAGKASVFAARSTLLGAREVGTEKNPQELHMCFAWGGRFVNMVQPKDLHMRAAGEWRVLAGGATSIMH